MQRPRFSDPPRVRLPPGLDTAREGLAGAYRDYNLDGCDPEALVEVVAVTSDFYPDLQAYYEEEAVEWLAQVEAGGAD